MATPVATLGPLFAARIVYVMVSLTTGACVFTIDRLLTATTVAVSVAVLLEVSLSDVLPNADAVLVMTRVASGATVPVMVTVTTVPGRIEPMVHVTSCSDTDIEHAPRVALTPVGVTSVGSTSVIETA